MACREVASEVVLIDIKEGLSEGKMLDMYQCSTLMDFDTKLVGVTNDYKQTANSDVVVITSGIPRKPGMTREELIGTNANIMKGVIENVVKYSPRAIIIVVANPMDTLTYLALKASGLPKNRIIGMGGALDSSRFKCYLAKATGANINNVDGMVIGGHGDTTMIPLVSKATVNGVPVSQFASKKKLEEAVANTMVGGATLTKLIGTSAWYAPGGRSTIGRLFQDACGRYAFADDTHSGSVPLAFETVFDKAGDADVWLVKYNRDRDMSYADLEADYIGYTGFKAFKTRNVYGCNTAKVPFYEETPFRPDYLLSDLIQILHPEIGDLGGLRYFCRLKE